jgi:hypothetical protein
MVDMVTLGNPDTIIVFINLTVVCHSQRVSFRLFMIRGTYLSPHTYRSGTGAYHEIAPFFDNEGKPQMARAPGVCPVDGPNFFGFVLGYVVYAGLPVASKTGERTELGYSYVQFSPVYIFYPT